MTAFIWDLDGTLIDSYGAIIEALEVVYKTYNLSFDSERLYQFTLEYSVHDLLEQEASTHGLPFEEMKSLFVIEQDLRNDSICLKPFAKEILEESKEKGVEHFIYTHKGSTTKDVLENLGIASYFTEMLTAASGFKRKPDPEALLYLVETYHLDRATTYYIGDRPIDVEAARLAGLASINLCIASSSDNEKIEDLSDLRHWF